MTCPATFQAVLEFDEDLCPICDDVPELHRNEDDDPELSLTEEWARDEAAHDWGGS